LAEDVLHNKCLLNLKNLQLELFLNSLSHPLSTPCDDAATSMILTLNKITCLRYERIEDDVPFIPSVLGANFRILGSVWRNFLRKFTSSIPQGCAMGFYSHRTELLCVLRVSYAKKSAKHLEPRFCACGIEYD